jgi:Na+/H+-dicarboxylate symporter
MKIWIKLLTGAALGITLGFFLPEDSAALRETLAWLGGIAVNAGRYALIPPLFFSLAAGIYELRQERRFWPLTLYTAAFMAAGTVLIIVLGIAVTLIFQPGPVPIQIEEQAGDIALAVRGSIAGLLPANAFSALVNSGDYLLPLCLFAFFLGLGLSHERLHAKPVLALLDSLSRVFYHVIIFFSEMLSLVLIVLAAYWAVRFRGVFPGEKFRDLVVLLGVFSLTVGFGVFPLLLYFLKPRPNPWKALYALLGPALAAFFSGDINFSLPVLMRHEKENLGVKRRVNTFTLSLFSAFGRAGSAAIAAMAFIVIIKSYSSLEVTAADLLFIALRSFGIAFLLARRPGDGAFAALAVLCAGYDPSGYLILKPLAFYLVACGTFLDVMFSAFSSYALARMTGLAAEREARNFI